MIRQNEYKSFPELADIFRGRSKTGKGDAFPDFLVVTSGPTVRPVMVIETKAKEDALPQALHEASEIYGAACLEAGHPVLAVGVSGQENTTIRVGVLKFHLGEWKPVKYENNPISWIPTPADVDSLLSSPTLMDLAPVIPDPEVLAERADLINRILREANIKDEFRPAYVGAMMLALWHTKGNLRRDPRYVLRDINAACEEAFKDAGKPELARSLHVDEANAKLAASAWRVLSTLEKLNVATSSFAHDYLGQLYETFFRYTGGNTIGQYFTPRHIARMMADLCESTPSDVVIDPACGTGGFLIAAMQRAYDQSSLRYEDAIELVREKLIGYESEPVTAALAVANMLLRGDGKTGIRKEDCFTATDYPVNACDIALMNPPFPHKKTDVPPERFVERALEALRLRGRIAVILPTSLTVKKENAGWRKQILTHNTLLGVVQLPDELFQPYASATTTVVLLEKGIPHDARRETAFVRLHYDGLTLKKGIRVPRSDGRNQVPDTVDAIVNKRVIPGFSGVAAIQPGDEWAPGAYIPSAPPDEDELRTSIDELLRRWTSFYIRYAREVATQRKAIANGEIDVHPYRNLLSDAKRSNASNLPAEPGTIGGMFDIYYGMKELHSREGIPPGDSLIISPTEEYNGCYGWLTFRPLIEPPFITVAQTGSIGEAFVQTEPCAVNDDCLVLLPKPDVDVPLAGLVVAAAAIRLERWRFNYGRKLTPARIASFRVPTSGDLERWVEDRLDAWAKICESAVDVYSEA
ncbi:N-6 DNA methylase [Sphaerobacter thermophilus DSM 20745]|uniref:site-specific DNA-methyltransferase (adenine-specific) n=1 Tax=Sphaerobacter thermophilus (strain ATCC 49802 / DSM 20745 / KCCM 41009 / NCIMB 13125 / S 6022) TaxID=479434 RepID=D1C9Q9_SPHTD|nr:N-6 DNA methylase [Sphaerobacter thermophilus DSM 20745]